MTEWLSDTLLATSALLLLVLLIRVPVAKHFGAGTAYLLWALPAARLFMPTLSQEVVLPAQTPVADNVREAALAALAGGGNMAPPASVPAIDWITVGLSLWLGGAALLFIVQMYRYVAMRGDLLSDATEIDRIGTVRIIRTDRVGGPLAFGLFSRYVAVPRDFTHTFSPRERELALAHELAHHRGGDLFANMAAFLFLCLMWFNPLAWLAWSAFRFDQEAACDARVIAGADALTRQTYGRALARTATEGLPAFAMALNSPRTIIQRLRRLMMNETSKGRRLTGKLAILVGAAVALPLTATVVPVYADDSAAAPTDKAEPRKKTVILVRQKDGKPATVDISGDKEAPFVRTIKKDGKTIILRTTHELSDSEVEKLVADAEKSRAEADAAAGEADRARSEADAAWGEAEAARAEADAARGEAVAVAADAEERGRQAMLMVGDMDFASFVPDIQIREFHGRCKEGETLSTNVRGFDGKNKSRVKIMMCGKGQAKIARIEAIKGLREARDEIADNEDMPADIRKSVLKSLKKQIERMQDELNGDSAA
ncbi:MAG: M56 family metallopeptidase [Sphingorhabdus sp.]